MARRPFEPDPNEERTVVYNPMTGGRRDLEVEKEDGAAAGKTHKRWGAARVKYLERLIADPDTSADARASYLRELGRNDPPLDSRALGDEELRRKG